MNKRPKNETVQAKSPSIQSETPGPIAPPPAQTPVEEMEVNQSESDLNLLKEDLPKPILEPIGDLEPIIPTTPIEPEIHDKMIKDINGTPFREAAKKDYTEEVEETFPDETVFKYPLDGKEKTAYENILKSNRETIRSLRAQLQESLATTDALRAELEAKNTKE